MSSKQPEWTLLFQHLPKTGGTTLSHIILRHFDKAEVFHVRSPKHPKAPIYSDSWGPVDEFLSLPAARRLSFRCILGHMHIGIHQHVPGLSKYITILRDPLERVLSQHGQYNRMVMNNEIGDGQTVSLEEFFELQPGTVQNHQARFLTMGSFDKLTEEEKIAVPIDNLKRFYAVVGTLERFDETVLILNRLMGWPSLPYTRRNVGTLRSSQSQHPPELVRFIREKNSVDYQLLEYANHWLDRAIASYGPEFSRDLAALRRANRRKERKMAARRFLSLRSRLSSLKHFLGKWTSKSSTGEP